MSAGADAAVDEPMPHLRRVRPHLREVRGELGVGVDGDGVAVVDDVGRLLGREPVVERHRRDARLARRVHHAHHAGRIHAAPEHGLARAARRVRAARCRAGSPGGSVRQSSTRSTDGQVDRRSPRACRDWRRRGQRADRAAALAIEPPPSGRTPCPRRDRRMQALRRYAAPDHGEDGDGSRRSRGAGDRGGRGIGRAIALALAEDGADVAVNYRKDEAAAQETVAAIEALGRRACAYAGSVDDATTTADASSTTSSPTSASWTSWSTTPASRAAGNSVEKTDPAELERVIRIHALGATPALPARAAEHAHAAARRHRDDLERRDAAPRRPAARPTTWARRRSKRSRFTLAKEVKKHGIRVNVVAPGLVETDMGRRLMKATAGVDDLRTARRVDALRPRLPARGRRERRALAGLRARVLRHRREDQRVRRRLVARLLTETTPPDARRSSSPTRRRRSCRVPLRVALLVLGLRLRRPRGARRRAAAAADDALPAARRGVLRAQLAALLPRAARQPRLRPADPRLARAPRRSRAAPRSSRSPRSLW